MRYFLKKYTNNALKNPRIIKYVAIATLLIFIYFLLGLFDAFELWHDFSSAHEDWELDEIPLLFIFATVWLAWIYYEENRAKRKALRHLEAEIQRRQLIELELLLGFLADDLRFFLALTLSDLSFTRN